MTRLLETGFETKFHALQVVFARMSITALIGSVYLWWKRTPDFPLGPPGVRRLLVLRGFAGTTGLFGLYCECHWLTMIVTFTDANQTLCRSWKLLTLLSLRFWSPVLPDLCAGLHSGYVETCSR